jgi:hypothetical protein
MSVTQVYRSAVVSPFYGLCEIFWKATTIYGVLRFQKPPNMAFKQNWRKSSSFKTTPITKILWGDIHIAFGCGINSALRSHNHRQNTIQQPDKVRPPHIE